MQKGNGIIIVSAGAYIFILMMGGFHKWREEFGVLWKLEKTTEMSEGSKTQFFPDVSYESHHRTIV